MISRITLFIFVVFLIMIHIGALLAFTHFFNFQLLLLTVLLWQTCSLIGISVCYHREITHKSFKSHPCIKVFHLSCALIAGQAGPIVWAHVHRVHHKYSDTAFDPHSPNNGFMNAHLGWLFQYSKRKLIPDFSTIPSDLKNDKLLVFFQFIHYPFQLFLFFIFYYFGGIEMLVWLGCVRLCLSLHSAWIINSLGHTWGYKSYDTNDQSKNSKLLAFFTAGEGLHNNHHKRPSSAKLSHQKGEFDLGYQYIKCLKFWGLIYDVKS